jgi:CRISPR/Cas system Type II protein with McrA/HNH and RuvC-like nuclease domain
MHKVKDVVNDLLYNESEHSYDRMRMILLCHQRGWGMYDGKEIYIQKTEEEGLLEKSYL